MIEPNNQSNRFWLLVVGILLAVCVAAAVFLHFRTTEGMIAEVWLDGECIERIDLSAVKESYTFPVTGKSGLTNLIEVEPGRIRVREADCPDQICVDQGWMSDGGRPIVCLPNTLVIQIANPSEDAPDGVVG